MQGINNMTNINSPAFCGATQLFRKRILEQPLSFYELSKQIDSPYVGSLPNEIIKDIIALSKNPQDKKNIIMQVMDGFSKTAECIYKQIDAEKDSCITRACNRIWEFLTERNIKNSEYKYCPQYTPEEKNKIGKNASSLLTKALRETGILRYDEKVEMSYIGDGSYKNVFSIKFPKRTGYSPKVISIFKAEDRNLEDILDDSVTTSGLLPELNMSVYINNRRQKNSPFIKTYFGSIKDNFILSDDANYVPTGKELDNEIFKKMNLIHWDLREENIVNGWVIDLGGLKMRDPRLARPHQRKN